MQAIRPDGMEVLASGDYDMIMERARAEKSQDPNTEVNVYGPRETINLKNGSKLKVTKQGLKLVLDEKKKRCNRKRNKAAKKARRKTRR